MKLNKVLCLILSLMIVLGLLNGCGSSGEGEKDSVAAFSIGYAQADITPSGNVSLVGFGDQDERFSNHTTEPLYATCIAVKDAAGDTVIIIAYDLLGSYEEWATPARVAIAEKMAFPLTM